ncbi:methyltransferase domain-containing protein [Paracoccus sp. S-4012]|uniref:class I SAM-dependent methyltransferase n=1 Tax=Paracoccus sp. S-4012 TaxID=2665648 RepID=UPI0012B100F4|nr:class I SAM-dependent methyltransferase [Paracoccus sp. S-4012]MRX51219.1 methyltransferase domain-containing protein [Paracoccus sp. S-4012]
MSEIEKGVAAHYGGPDLLSVILGAAAGPDGTLRPEILERIDEFHIGGSAATERLLDRMDLAQGARLLDIGSGVGGPARRAARRRLEVTGIDLTERFVAAATDLTSRLPALRVQFRQGSALALPFPDASFDAAMMIHVGINIADKPRLMAEVARVLRPGGVFAVYDPMRLDDAAAVYPLPWADGPGTDFLDTAEAYRRAAEGAGLELTAEIPRAEEAKAFFAMMREKAAEAQAAGVPPPPGIGLVMGAGASQKLANIAAAAMQGHVAPIELHFRKPS